MSGPTDPLISLFIRFQPLFRGARPFSRGVWMKKLNFEKQTVLAASVVTVPMASVAWLMAVPAVVSPVTFAAISIVAFGAAYVGFNTWRNGQATENIGHVLLRTEATAERSGAGSAVDLGTQR
jgi:hypothetical protein